MKVKAVFNQAVEGVEKVEVVVEADTVDDALQIIEEGRFDRYRVVNNNFARTKQLGTVEIVAIY